MVFELQFKAILKKNCDSFNQISHEKRKFLLFFTRTGRKVSFVHPDGALKEILKKNCDSFNQISHKKRYILLFFTRTGRKVSVAIADLP